MLDISGIRIKIGISLQFLVPLFASVTGVFASALEECRSGTCMHVTCMCLVFIRHDACMFATEPGGSLRRVGCRRSSGFGLQSVHIYPMGNSPDVAVPFATHVFDGLAIRVGLSANDDALRPLSKCKLHLCCIS